MLDDLRVGREHSCFVQNRKRRLRKIGGANYHFAPTQQNLSMENWREKYSYTLRLQTLYFGWTHRAIAGISYSQRNDQNIAALQM
jgi:hypothetical protein